MSNARRPSVRERREKLVERALANRLRALGIKVSKNHGTPYSGTRLDLDCTRDGRIVVVEVKRSPREKLTPNQRAEARDHRRVGTPVLVCSGSADVERVVELAYTFLREHERIDSDDALFAETERSAGG